MLAAGCRSGWPAPPTEEERARFGAVAVAVAPPPVDDMGRPVSGWAAGLGMGTLRGAWATVALAVYLSSEWSRGSSSEAGGFAAFAGFVVGATLGLLYTPVSMVAGAVTAPDRGEVARAEEVIRPIVTAPALPGTLRDRFAAEAGLSFTSVEEADTVVEVRLDAVGGGSTWNWITFDRPFEVVVEATALVYRKADRTLIWSATRRVPDRGDIPRCRTFVEWASGDGHLLRDAIDRAIDRLAAGFSWSIFLQRAGDPLPEPVKEADR